jgi:diaminohydroxyphosphoribosylaminopyrimidine deaminase/5-amino-6-(5-phosphoribosylamino)uracil reductase
MNADAELDVTAMVQSLAAEGLTSVFCEGGGSLAASLLKAGLVDDLVVYTAGLALGSDGLAGVANLGVERLQEVGRFTLASWRKIGTDTRQHWRQH